MPMQRITLLELVRKNAGNEAYRTADEIARRRAFLLLTRQNACKM